MIVEAKEVGFGYDASGPVLEKVSFGVKEGEIVSLLGPSGCGKSTVLRLIADLLVPQSGEIAFQSTDITPIGFVFQDPSLMPWATVAENVLLPLSLKKDAFEKGLVDELLTQVGLGGMGGRYPGTLSGGQKMRVSFARAMASSPKLMLMDEPFGALDEILRFQMNEMVLKLRSEQGWSGIFVTHSIYEAAYLSDRVLVMNEGCVVGSVTPGLDRTIEPEEQKSSQAFMAAVQDISRLLAGRRMDDG